MVGGDTLTDYVIAFFVMVFFLTLYFVEDERTDSYTKWVERTEQRHNGLTDAENWELQDSLWELIRYEGDMGIEYGDSIMVKKK